MHDNILPVLTAFALVLLLLAGYTQWGARNLGTLLNIGWLLAGNLIFLVNAVVWRDTYDDIAPVWCDICEC
jgi:pheromone a factor receptor